MCINCWFCFAWILALRWCLANESSWERRSGQWASCYVRYPQDIALVAFSRKTDAYKQLAWLLSRLIRQLWSMSSLYNPSAFKVYEPPKLKCSALDQASLYEQRARGGSFNIRQDQPRATKYWREVSAYRSAGQVQFGVEWRQRSCINKQTNRQTDRQTKGRRDPACRSSSP